MRFDRGPGYDGQARSSAHSAPSSCPTPTGSVSAAAQCCRGSNGSPSPRRSPAGTARAPTAATRPSPTDTAPHAASGAPSPIATRRELRGVALITDRGREHARNEDAAAAGILTGAGADRPHAIAAAVCDGVSTSGDSHTAAVAASKAGVEAMVAALTASRRARAAVLLGLAGAAEAAAGAGAGTDLATAPSCTYTAAAVVPTATGTVEIAVGNVGDSRVYWLPAPPAPPQQLTVDDSVARN